MVESVAILKQYLKNVYEYVYTEMCYNPCLASLDCNSQKPGSHYLRCWGKLLANITEEVQV